MFVLRSTFDEQRQALLESQRETQQLKDRISQLELEAREFHGAVQAEPDRTIENGLLDAMLESLQQISGIRETVLSSFLNISAEKDSISDLSELFGSSSDSLQSILSEMCQLDNKMGRMNNEISGLSGTADNINRFVTTISSISDQTNLLALNAAIEAARAGDAGRGFSVVADEVRALANETNKSASEVADLVKGIIQSTRSAVTVVDELQGNNTQLSDGIQHLRGSYDRMMSHCMSMKDTISESSHQTFVQTVKLDHVVWKSEVYAVILQKSHKAASEFADHLSCRLGKWYQQQQNTGIAGLDAYKKLDQPHSTVHRCGVDAMNAAANQQNEKAQQLLEQMEAASKQVMELLDRIAGHPL